MNSLELGQERLNVSDEIWIACLQCFQRVAVLLGWNLKGIRETIWVMIYPWEMSNSDHVLLGWNLKGIIWLQKQSRSAKSQV